MNEKSWEMNKRKILMRKLVHRLMATSFFLQGTKSCMHCIEICFNYKISLTLCNFHKSHSWKHIEKMSLRTKYLIDSFWL